jgi:hypothetical protein
MHATVTHRPAALASSHQSHPEMDYRRTVPRPAVVQLESHRADVGTIVADDSLVIESIPEEQLHRLPAAIVSFLMRSTRRGYCPPLPVLRRLGFRTRSELEQQLAVCWRW